MTNSAKSVYFFGIYLYLVGLTLVFIPNLFLRIIQLPESHEVWIRIVGLLTFIIGFYYHRTGAKNISSFFILTVCARIGVFITFIVFVLMNFTSPILILFGMIDLAGAAWTWFALKNDNQATS